MPKVFFFLTTPLLTKKLQSNKPIIQKIETMEGLSLRRAYLPGIKKATHSDKFRHGWGRGKRAERAVSE